MRLQYKIILSAEHGSKTGLSDQFFWTACGFDAETVQKEFRSEKEVKQERNEIMMKKSESCPCLSHNLWSSFSWQALPNTCGGFANTCCSSQDNSTFYYNARITPTRTTPYIQNPLCAPVRSHINLSQIVSSECPCQKLPTTPADSDSSPAARSPENIKQKESQISSATNPIFAVCGCLPPNEWGTYGPFRPWGPCGPTGPWGPCHPCGPYGRNGPCLPYSPASSRVCGSLLCGNCCWGRCGRGCCGVYGPYSQCGPCGPSTFWGCGSPSGLCGCGVYCLRGRGQCGCGPCGPCGCGYSELAWRPWFRPLTSLVLTYPQAAQQASGDILTASMLNELATPIPATNAMYGPSYFSNVIRVPSVPNYKSCIHIEPAKVSPSIQLVPREGTDLTPTHLSHSERGNESAKPDAAKDNVFKEYLKFNHVSDGANHSNDGTNHSDGGANPRKDNLDFPIYKPAVQNKRRGLWYDILYKRLHPDNMCEPEKCATLTYDVNKPELSSIPNNSMQPHDSDLKYVVINKLNSAVPAKQIKEKSMKTQKSKVDPEDEKIRLPTTARILTTKTKGINGQLFDITVELYPFKNRPKNPLGTKPSSPCIPQTDIDEINCSSVLVDSLQSSSPISTTTSPTTQQKATSHPDSSSSFNDLLSKAEQNETSSPSPFENAKDKQNKTNSPNLFDNATENKVVHFAQTNLSNSRPPNATRNQNVDKKGVYFTSHCSDSSRKHTPNVTASLNSSKHVTKNQNIGKNVRFTSTFIDSRYESAPEDYTCHSFFEDLERNVINSINESKFIKPFTSETATINKKADINALTSSIISPHYKHATQGTAALRSSKTITTNQSSDINTIRFASTFSDRYSKSKTDTKTSPSSSKIATANKKADLKAIQLISAVINPPSKSTPTTTKLEPNSIAVSNISNTPKENKNVNATKFKGSAESSTDAKPASSITDSLSAIINFRSTVDPEYFPEKGELLLNTTDQKHIKTPKKEKWDDAVLNYRATVDSGTVTEKIEAPKEEIPSIKAVTMKKWNRAFINLRSTVESSDTVNKKPRINADGTMEQWNYAFFNFRTTIDSHAVSDEKPTIKTDDKWNCAFINFRATVNPETVSELSPYTFEPEHEKAIMAVSSEKWRNSKHKPGTKHWSSKPNSNVKNTLTNISLSSNAMPMTSGFDKSNYQEENMESPLPEPKARTPESIRKTYEWDWIFSAPKTDLMFPVFRSGPAHPRRAPFKTCKVRTPTSNNTSNNKSKRKHT